MPLNIFHAMLVCAKFALKYANRLLAATARQQKGGQTDPTPWLIPKAHPSCIR